MVFKNIKEGERMTFETFFFVLEEEKSFSKGVKKKLLRNNFFFGSKIVDDWLQYFTLYFETIKTTGIL